MTQKETIILTTSSNKKNSMIKKSNFLEPIKWMTFQELKEKLFFSYDEKAIYEVMKREEVSSSIAQIYLENLYFLDGNCQSLKVQKLREMKTYLKENGYLKETPLFKTFLKRQQILIIGKEELNKEELRMLEGYSYEIEKKEKVGVEIPLFVSNTLEEEVIYLACSIMKLLKKGILPSKIKIINVNDEYRMAIQKIFSWYHIPTTIDLSKTVASLPFTKKMLEQASFEEKFAYLTNHTHTEEEEKIASVILPILNRYVSLPQDEITQNMFLEELKQTTLPHKEKKNAVKEGNLDTEYQEDDYLFIVGFNQGVLPRIYKDEDYLSDKESEELGRLTSLDKNSEEKNRLHYFLEHHKHIQISYKIKTLTDSFYPSSFLEEIPIHEEKGLLEYEDSHFMNQFLLSKMLDSYYQYNIYHSNLSMLYQKYANLPYQTYQNQFQKVSTDKIQKAFKNQLLLSYSSLDNYNRCAFRYYLQYILKLNEFEDTFMQQLGSLFHYVLSKAFLEPFDFDTEWNFYIDNNPIGKNKKEIFFLKKLKKELLFIIDEIHRQYQYSELKQAFYEEKIYTHPTNEEEVTFMGIIDKLLYKKDENIVAVVDYKTGNPNLNLQYLPYGIEMQLPIYLYLVHHFSKIENPTIVGFYLQKILHNEIMRKDKISYEEQKSKNLYLQGYSLEKEDILQKLDSSYQDSKVIKSMKTNSSGFYAYSKVLTQQEMNKILELAEENIKKVISSIQDGEFSINPKRVGFEMLGCEFCPYQDICYHTEKDVVNLKEYKDLEFLGGDENASMD